MSNMPIDYSKWDSFVVDSSSEEEEDSRMKEPDSSDENEKVESQEGKATTNKVGKKWKDDVQQEGSLGRKTHTANLPACQEDEKKQAPPMNVQPLLKEGKEKDTVTFYHFTRPSTAFLILNHGIRKGDVVTSFEAGFNAVWLTTDPDPSNFRITGSPVVEAEKRKVRIKLVLRKDDPNLMKWYGVANKYRVEDKVRRGLDYSGGGQSHNWWVYRGKITKDSFLMYSLWHPNQESYVHTDSSERFYKLVGECGYMNAGFLLFQETHPEPETGWPRLGDVNRCCANPGCPGADKSQKIMKTCTRCKMVQYCSKACQKKNWKAHKKMCSMKVRDRDTNAPFFYMAGQETRPYLK